ncbi:MAG: protein kinase [Magnetococcales bacterium]|nr:protein kinase [Magnetococcales bacterium]
MANFRHIPCGSPVNESESRAIQRLGKLESLPNGPWRLLSNVSHSINRYRLPDEIDQIIVGPTGVFVVEVKHWDSNYDKKNELTASKEAERLNEKARRVKGKLITVFNPGFVTPRFLLTASDTTGLQNNQRKTIRGVGVFGLSEWQELVGGHASLSADQIDRAVTLLQPATKEILTGDLLYFADLIELNRISSGEDSFHRIYRGRHRTRGDKVILHLYDLSASRFKDAKGIAEREFEVIQCWQKSPYIPKLLDSFQSADHYPGELFYFSMVDPDAVSVEERTKYEWSHADRLKFAWTAMEVLLEFHQPQEAGLEKIIHRNITPQTLRVRSDGKPLFTDFSLSRLGSAPTISHAVASTSTGENWIAPEVRRDGIACADSGADVFALCVTLQRLFDNSPQNRAILNVLQQGCREEKEQRPDLPVLIAALKAIPVALDTSDSTPLDAHCWHEDTIVDFRDSKYRISGSLGSGGIGRTFRVVQIDPDSQEEYGVYVAKLIYHQQDGESALRAYKKVRSHTTHDHMSAIHEIAHEWRKNELVALLKWVEGEPLANLRGVLAIYAEDCDKPFQNMILDWIKDLCSALQHLHQAGLVHGDISPQNIIVHQSSVTLIDYDAVTDVGAPPRNRNPLYASSEVDRGESIHPRDDLFALAASLFHVLFERDPFLFPGGQRTKTKGIYWDGIKWDGLEEVKAFLDGATSPIIEQRFEQAEVAKRFVNRLLSPETAVIDREELSPSASIAAEHNSWLRELLSGYPGSRYGNSETRGLDSEFSRNTYVETELDHRLRDEINSGQLHLLLLFGNAGDGKTAFLQHLLQQLGLEPGSSEQRIQQHRLKDGRTLHVNLDGSASWKGQSANELLDQFLAPFHSLDPAESVQKPHILAINSGKLLEWLESTDESPLADYLYQAIFRDESDSHNDVTMDEQPKHVRLIDLNHRSLVGSVRKDAIATDFLEALLNRFLGDGRQQDLWRSCQRCSSQSRCLAWQSVQTLRDQNLGPRVRERLATILQACHMRGEVHITVRQLRAALIFIFFGVDDCQQVHSNQSTKTKITHYWDRVFDSQISHRQGDLLVEISRLDPALDNDPILDRELLQKFPLNNNPVLDQQQQPRELLLIEQLASIRRRAWFEHEDVGRLHLFTGQYLESFRRVSFMSESDRCNLCKELCRGMACLEDLPPRAFDLDGLPLRIIPNTPTETIFWVVKPWERFALEVPSVVDQSLEYLPTQLWLTYRTDDGRPQRLIVSLSLFNHLLLLADGEQLTGRGQEGLFSHLTVFTQRLVQENIGMLYGWHPAQDPDIFRFEIVLQDGRRILRRQEVTP